MLGRIGTSGQLAFDGSLGQHARVRDHGLHRRLHGAQRLGQGANLVFLAQGQRGTKITRRHVIGMVHQLTGRRRDAARDEPAQHGTQHHCQPRQYHQQALCAFGQLFCCLAALCDQDGLALCQGLHRSDVVSLAGAQCGRQHAGRFFKLACLDHVHITPHVLHVGRTGNLDFLQAGFACIRGDHLLQLGKAFGDDAALLWQTIEFLLGFSALEDIGIAQYACIDTKGLDHLVGKYRLGKIILHQCADISTDLIDAGHANAGHNDQQGQRGAEADGQPDSNLHVLEHIDLFLKNWLNSVLPGSLKWFRPMPGFRPFCCLQSLGPPVVSRRVRPESGRLRRCPEWWSH